MATPPTHEDLARHRAACEAGQDGYRDAEGRWVLTSRYLRRCGDCCGQGCRHCPWPPEVQARAGRPAEAPAWPWPAA